jgi:hypothetical protein
VAATTNVTLGSISRLRTGRPRSRAISRLDEVEATWTSPRAQARTNLATHVDAFTFKTADPGHLQVLLERMMGLEPSTFCMASES